MLGIEYCHLKVRIKTLGITVKEIKCYDHIYPAGFHKDSFIFSSVSIPFFFMFQLLLATLWYIFCEYIFKQSKIFKTSIFFCQRLGFFVVVWCLLYSLLLLISYICRYLSLSLCYIYLFTLLCIYVLCILFAKKMPLTPMSHLCVCVCERERQWVCVCEWTCLFHVEFVLLYQSFIYEWTFSDLCQICWF